MTDNDIIKALECCSSQPKELCCNCPIDIRKIKGGCITALTTNALDLINRLQAENERLSKITRPLIGEIKAEAYTEFAELLCKIWQRFEDENICGISNQGLVKFVCKEMVGGNE